MKENEVQKYRDLGNNFRKVVDILEQMVDIAEDEEIDEKEAEEKLEKLLGDFLVQMLKIQSIKM